MFVAWWLQSVSPCSWIWIRLPPGLPWRRRPHSGANLLVSWHRMAPAWREIHPLTPACHEIIEPCSVPDCMLSWCSPNLFHSLIRGFDCRKGTEWAVTGGMTSVLLLSWLCHMEFEWSDFSVASHQPEDKAAAQQCIAWLFSEFWEHSSAFLYLWSCMLAQMLDLNLYFCALNLLCIWLILPRNTRWFHHLVIFNSIFMCKYSPASFGCEKAIH